MSKKIKTLLLVAFLGCLVVGDLNVCAAENKVVEIPQENIAVIPPTNDLEILSSASLSACEIGIGIASNGVQVTLVTTATQRADEIGVKNVVIQEKTLFGWKDIPVSNYCTYNSDLYAGGIVYTLATKGTTYRVKCTHYAKFGSTELTLDNTSSELVYN